MVITSQSSRPSADVYHSRGFRVSIVLPRYVIILILAKMEVAVNSEVQRERKLSSAEGTKDPESESVVARHFPWTVRKILILVSLFLVYFLVFAVFSEPTPFFPNEVSVFSIISNSSLLYNGDLSPLRYQFKKA